MNSRNVLWTGGIALAIVALATGGWGYHKANAEKNQEKSIRDQVYISNGDNTVAPDFTLQDQRGQTITLSALKGKVVILQPMDPACTDVCPLVSQELIDANQKLGDKAKDVVYLGLNVNEDHESQAELMDFSQQHRLNSLPNWHFLTGTTDQLKAVWKAYGIDVTPNKDGDVEHSTDMYFIDPNGKERYVGFPDSEKDAMSEWSIGIEFFAKKLM